MVDCGECNSIDIFPYTCSLCKSKFCSEHQLPESHNCLSLAYSKSSVKWFDDDGAAPVGRQNPSKESGKTLIWRCQDCSTEYATNQADCVRCGEQVFEPIEVTLEEKRERLPSTARRRRRRQKRARQSESTSQAPNADDDMNDPSAGDTEPKMVNIWTLQRGLFSRLGSMFRLKRSRGLVDVTSDTFVQPTDDSHTVYRISPPSPSSDADRYLVVEYEVAECETDSIQLRKSGTRAYAKAELENRLSDRIVRQRTVEVRLLK